MDLEMSARLDDRFHSLLLFSLTITGRLDRHRHGILACDLEIVLGVAAAAAVVVVVLGEEKRGGMEIAI